MPHKLAQTSQIISLFATLNLELKSLSSSADALPSVSIVLLQLLLNVCQRLMALKKGVPSLDGIDILRSLRAMLIFGTEYG